MTFLDQSRKGMHPHLGIFCKRNGNALRYEHLDR